MTDSAGNILIVDDTPNNLRLLSTILVDHGYVVRKALNGKIALNTVHQVPPDLILLDINMPESNGYEVCETLKADRQTQEIPIIFMSALDDVLDKVKAFRVGGVDYITKPFQAEEVIARIEHQLTIQKQKRQLQLEVQERKKAEESLQVYLHAVSHDLRNPVLGMGMVLQNLLNKAQSHPEMAIATTVLERMKESCDRQLNLINSLVETQQFETEGMILNSQPLNITELIRNLSQDWQPFFQKDQTTLKTKIDANLPLITADKDQLLRVFENLITNAIKHNPTGITLTIGAVFKEKKVIYVSIQDSGLGIEPEQMPTLFQRYQRGKKAQKTVGLGLGLYLCRLIIEAHGGEMGVESVLGEGTTFWFTLPVAREWGGRNRELEIDES